MTGRLRESRGRPVLLGVLEAVGIGVVLLVALTGLSPSSPIQDAVTLEAVPYASLHQPVAYLVGAPLFGLWDALSLLTLTQHYAILLTLLLAYVAVRVRRTRAARMRALSRPPPLWNRALAEAGRAVGWLVVLLAFYASGVFVPRPMTGLELVDPDRLTIDFHSHTHWSHDGWSRFTAQRNRSWHEQGGFDAAYITDHYTWRGFDEAAPENPNVAGERTVLLEGAELRIHRRPTNALGARYRYLGSLDADSVYMEPDSLIAAHARGEAPPTLLYTMPGMLRFVVPWSATSPAGVIGIEVNDGSPLGLEQVRAERAEIVALADSLNLALIGASNLHGWGRTVASWSVMSLPGWQSMAPGTLGGAIERTLHAARRNAVVVIERRMPYHDGSMVRAAATVPWLTLEHFRMLAPLERLSWIGWTLVLLAVRAARRRRRTT